MTNLHPTVEQVTQSLPDYTEVQEIGRGGFKTVFRAKYRSSLEVVKLIGLSREGLTNQEKLFRDECLGRAVRETRILGECKSPLIVKLGKLNPQKLEINGFDYVAYSEEYLDGSWKLIQGRKRGRGKVL